MEIIKGNYTEAVLYLSENPNNDIDQYAWSQISMLCNQESLSGARIRIMPDVHPGKVGTMENVLSSSSFFRNTTLSLLKISRMLSKISWAALSKR